MNEDSFSEAPEYTAATTKKTKEDSSVEETWAFLR
jgi:hypothetical protein